MILTLVHLFLQLLFYYRLYFDTPEDGDETVDGGRMQNEIDSLKLEVILDFPSLVIVFILFFLQTARNRCFPCVLLRHQVYISDLNPFLRG